MTRFGSLVALAAVLFWGCGGGEKQEALGPAAEIVSFEASADSVEAGDEITLEWETKHAAAISLTANGEPVDLEDGQDSLRIRLEKTTLFELEARGPGGSAHASRLVKAEVVQPRILSFTATPGEVDEGEEVVLAWETELAESLVLGTNTGELLDIAGVDPSSGSIVVRPMEATTYYLTAKRRSQSTTRSVHVAIKGGPRLRLLASPMEVEWGETVTVTWEAEDADVAQLYRGDELLAEGSSGSYEDLPPHSDVYRLVATRGEKQSETTHRIRVRPKILTFAPESESPMPVGTPISLRWEVGGAEELTLENGAGETVTLQVDTEASGTTPLPLGSGEFTLEARSGELTTRATARVPILLPPTIASFSADETEVSGGPDRPAIVTLRWEGVERAADLELEGDTTGPIDLTGLSIEAGEVEVEVVEDTVFTLRATNAAGEATAQESVKVFPYPTIERFEAVPAYVAPMERFELVWEVTGESLEILEDETPLPDLDFPGGRIELERAASTSFTLRVSNEVGAVIEETIEVTVGSLQNLHLGVSPTYVAPGEEVTISWENLGGRLLELRDSDGDLVCEVLDHANIDRGACSVVVHDEGLHTFHYKVANDTDEIEKTLEVTASEGPMILAFEGTPTELEVGGAIEFSWKVRNDPHGNVPVLSLQAGEEDFSLDGADPNQDSRSFTIETPGEKRFVLTATTPQGTKTAAFTALVHGLPEVRLTATPTAYDFRTPVQLGWTSAHAASLVLYQLDDAGQAIEPPLYVVPEGERAAGAFPVTPSTTTTYRIVAENLMGSQESAEVTVQVLPPEIASFTADREIVTATAEDAAIVTLSWSGVEHATQLELHADTLGPIDLSGLDRVADSIQVAITSSTSFTLTATNGGGSRERTVFVEAVPPPTIQSFTVFPSYVEPMEPFTIGWVTDGATEILIDSDGAAPGFVPNLPSFSFSMQIASSTTFELIARNAAGDEVRETQRVEVGPTGIVRFAASESYVPAGTTVVLDWETRGGRRLELFAGSNLLFQTTDLETIAEGELSRPIPAGLHELTLVIENHLGQRFEESLLVRASEGPVILDFQGTPADIEVGEAITFSWEVLDDPNGETPSLTLTDGTVAYDVSGADPNADARAFLISEAGLKTFTFTATTSMGSASRTFEARVHSPVSVALSANPPAADWENPVQLSWTSMNAEGGLLLYELDFDGNPVEPPLYEAAEGERAAGSFPVDPAEPTTYRVVAIGALGREAHDEVRVEILPPEILSFSVTPTEAVEMREITVEWSTQRATEVHLGVSQPMVVSETTEPFIDISTTGTPLTLQDDPLGPSDGGFADIEFPPHFRFPFGGVEQDRIRVMENGHAGFNFDFTGPSGNYARLPRWSANSHGANAHLIPFWDRLDARGQGGIFYEFGQDERGQRLIVQWHEVRSFYNIPNLSMSFQILLWEDGAFDFRYGSMTSDDPDYHDASSATIGYQSPAGGHFHEIHYGTGSLPVPGGLSHRGWAFREAVLPPTGSITLAGGVDLDQIVLTAKGPGGEAQDAEQLTVHPAITFTYMAPQEVRVGETIAIEWKATNATSVRIERQSDSTPLCSHPPGSLDEGICEIVEAVPGEYFYALTAEGPGGQRLYGVRRVRVLPAP